MPDRESVQGMLEKAALAFSGEAVTAVAAGRTDAGVHAAGQVAHIDFNRDHEPFTIMNAMNFHLWNPNNPLTPVRQVSVLAADKVSDEFHARFSAKARHYEYRVLARRSPSALDAGRVWHIPAPLDLTEMQRAATHLLGHHDFTSFRDTQCQSKTPMKTLDRLDVSAVGDEIVFRVSARSFLHHQVRIMVGTLIQVGTGRWRESDIPLILHARARTHAGPTAPADGLTLVRVDY